MATLVWVAGVAHVRAAAPGYLRECENLFVFIHGTKLFDTPHAVCAKRALSVRILARTTQHVPHESTDRI